jgi:hypothetical protein
MALLCVCSCPGAQAQTMEERARTAATAAQAKTGTSDALRENYVAPGISGQAISTIDSSATFTPSLSCQKTASLLQVLIQPGATGDITTLRISQDTDFDGSFDISKTLARQVSGICANGVISCDPGTWSQCHHLRWDIAADRAARLTEVEMPELAGCYCINNSCGTNLVWGNLAEVLKDIGGGIVGALTTSDPRIGVAQAQVSGPVIDYIGAQTTTCAASPSVSQTAYRATPAAIQSDAATLAASSSVFQALAASPSGLGKAEQVRNCTIERRVTVVDPSIDDIVSRTSGGYSEVRSSSTAIDFLMGSPADNSLSGEQCSLFDFRMILHVSDPARITRARLPEYFADDWAQVRIDGALVASGPNAWTTTGVPPGRCEKKDTFYAYPDLDLLPYLTQGDHEIWLRVAVAQGGEAFAKVHVEVDDACATSEQLVDQCAGYASDTQCRLVSEEVDGVATFTKGVQTGLKPLTQPRQFGADRCAVSVTRDFFERARSYSCVVNTGSIAAPDISRGAYIIDHSTETMLADQVRHPDGSTAQTTSAFLLPDRGSVAACEPVCKTRAPKVNTAASPAGVMAAQQNDPVGWDTFYHVCSAANVCPAGDGEEIVAACGCLDDFPEAVVMMQSVRLAGADMTCTRAAP